MRSKLFKAGSISLIGTFFVKAVNFISIPIFSRLMTTIEYGDANIFLTYVTIFTILISLDFHGTLAKGFLLYRDDEYGFISTGVFFTGIYLAVLLLIVNVSAGFWGNFLSLGRLELNLLLIYSYAMYIVTTKTMEYIFHFQYRENAFLCASVTVLNIVTSVVLMLTVLRYDKLEARILGASLPTIIIGATLYIHFMKRGKTVWNGRYLKHYLTQGIPLIPHNLSHLILGNADKIMIQNMISSHANGIYSLIYNLGLMLNVLIEALNNVFNPWMFRKLDARDYDCLKKTYSLYALLFSIISLAVAAVSPEIIKILAPEGYWEGNRYVLWIVFSTYLIFMYQLYVNIEFYDLKTYLISAGTVIAAAVNIILNLLFLQKYGYGFAAFSTVAAYFTLVVFHMLITNFILKRRFINNFHVFGLIAVVFFVTLLLQFLLDYWLVRWGIMVVMIVSISIWIFRNYRSGGLVSEILNNI